MRGGEEWPGVSEESGSLESMEKSQPMLLHRALSGSLVLQQQGSVSLSGTCCPPPKDMWMAT